MNEVIAAILARHEDRRAAIDEVYQHLENAGVVSKVTVHRYLCTRGCNVRATVVKADGLTLIRTEDYKFSRGYNSANSVEQARENRTIDGDRHWPKRTIDVAELAEWEGAARIQVACRHKELALDPLELLEMVANVVPGRPGPPTRL